MNQMFSNKILQAIGAFLLAFGSLNFVMLKVVTIQNYLICLVGFMLGIVTVSILYKSVLLRIIQKTERSEFLILLASLGVHRMICYYCIVFLGRPVLPFESSELSFLLINNFFVWVKPVDLLYQQLIIMVLIKTLYEYGMSLQRIIMLFVVIFGIAHGVQLFWMPLPIALGFLVFSIVASFIFPVLVLRVRNGYLYNIVIHLLAYDMAALLFWGLA